MFVCVCVGGGGGAGGGSVQTIVKLCPLAYLAVYVTITLRLMSILKTLLRIIQLSV